MPRKLRRPKARARELSPAMVTFLLTGDLPRGDDGRAVGWVEVHTKSSAELRADWLAVRDDLLGEWIISHPGTRPWGWWRFDAPRWAREDWPARQRDLGPWADRLFPEPRQRVGGVGTPVYEVLNYLPEFCAGVPVQWVTPFDAAYYRGEARDSRGAPIGTEYRDGHFEGLAPDPNDPPIFESEASYLRRHHLLMPGEEKRLPADAFEPEALRLGLDDDLDPRAEFPDVFAQPAFDER
jgi:hypothetical protein